MSESDNESGSMERIERRLLDEKYFSEPQVDVVMAVVEQELSGETDRDGEFGYMTEVGDIRYRGADTDH